MIYTVIWKYDVHAGSPIEAINIANAHMIEYHSYGWIYDVEDENGDFVLSGAAELEGDGKMYDISFCVKRKDLSNSEYDEVIKYMKIISYKEYDDGEIIEDIHMTGTYVFGTIDRDDSLYKFLSGNDKVEWNE